MRKHTFSSSILVWKYEWIQERNSWRDPKRFSVTIDLEL